MFPFLQENYFLILIFIIVLFNESMSFSCNSDFACFNVILFFTYKFANESTKFIFCFESFVTLTSESNSTLPLTPTSNFCEITSFKSEQHFIS